MTATALPVIVVGAGQSGLAAARAVRDAGLHPVVLEAGDRPAGSWPHYYDSLRVFSPARYSAMPGFPMDGDPDRYPTRDEVADYLDHYARHLGVDIRTHTRVSAVEADGTGFVVRTAGGDALPAAGVVAASGSFGSPIIPNLPGQETFAGELLHVAAYRVPAPYAGKRVIVVGGGNSGVQIADELAAGADLTLATLAPVLFLPQVIRGRDLHHWLDVTGFDHLPAAWLRHIVRKPLVLDTGHYHEAIASGQVERRAMFTAFDGDAVSWPDGEREHVDTVIFATGYRPDVDYLRPLGALDETGLPRHVDGISTTHPGLVYLGLEFQRSFSSNTLRGVSRDADYVVGPLAAHVRQAPATIGL
ncbi:flavin-containing monooxygenase [Jiangella alkaliphila]|uniref:Putative flavoprotein involved in K+ transport n=1 Tax=Jiangella alkaliphila TaxID=419479 RepID=A0A1H2KZU7_9ACTN|nr:NAD(P)-binding domain-containing protein [Jiangella alkaliphila]SDU73861.1 putative flavoprotein involved in K+ transport [Jiangella alkaliphila]